MRQTLFLLTSISLVVSDVQKLTITPNQGTTLNISCTPATGSGCTVCTLSGRKRECQTSRLLKDNSPVSVELECSKRQGAFSVEVTRTIECTTKSCSSNIQADSNLDALLNLNRKFTWNIKAAAPKAARIDFTKTGLRQIQPFESCPDKHTYTFEVFQESGHVTVGRYCRTGTITNAQALGRSRFSLELLAGQTLQNIYFTVSTGEEIKSLAKISLTLPQGLSSLELFSPNYPGSFPNDDLMEWYFDVPAKHKASIQLSNLTLPRCLRKEAAVEYHGSGRTSLVVSLADAQPVQNQGSFSVTLRNCEMDKSRAKSSGLSLNFKVSVSTASPVLCDVDMRKLPGFSLHIKKLSPSSGCIMKQKSMLRDQITVPADSVTQLSFEACLPEDVQVTATKFMECDQVKTCQKFSLSVPLLTSCLPAPLNNVTWTLKPPRHGTVELISPSGPLRQELPGQLCNDSISIKMAEDDGTTIGNFCRQGTIHKVQIHTNVSISVCGTEGKALTPSSWPLLTASITEKISERYIFSVSPKQDAPLVVATPGWPKGLKSYSTVSWIVTVPPKMQAHLMFANLSQPKCSTRHTNIMIQRIGSLEEDYSRREDETPDSEIIVSESFYLNISNCMPEKGAFSVVANITLQKSQKFIMIVSIVAALLVTFIVVLVVVCVVIRKKKKNLNHQVSIYNPNGSSFLPGQNGFPKSREDNESHVYESIEDSMVYTHLLRKGAQTGIYGESDTYQAFAGHTDSQKPPESRESGAHNMEVGIYQEFPVSHQQKPELPKRPPSHIQPIMDNNIYEFGEQSEDEQSPTLGPRLEPEGGN